ncbi:unnamed protein product [Caenorhabditis auriculariae]|uniref:Haloacid dehalogenase-like hydrolase domain-containing protein 2 n=1 Tax=Caenorhabditis auriculariae TaxID=2777116 RepID=A0A8S1HL24_9PELO|nr:unnamed protein product [Caenorhabditis auriculariae]
MSRIAAALIDLSGTIHVEDVAISGAVAALEKLRTAMPVRFVTNTTKESQRVLQERLLKCGFKIEKEEIFTSLLAASQLVRSKKLRPLLMLENEALEDFRGIETQNPNAVVIGLAPSHFEYDQMNEAFRLVINGAELIAIHKARYFKTKDGLSLGPGAFVTGLEFSTDRKATVVGKPQAHFFSAGLDAIRTDDVTESTTVMIGDDVNDDVIGAINAGMRGILVKTGKYRKGDEEKIDVQHRNVAESFVEAVDLILAGKVFCKSRRSNSWLYFYFFLLITVFLVTFWKVWQNNRISGMRGSTIGYIYGPENGVFFTNDDYTRIAIVSVVEHLEDIGLYETAISTMQCYAKIQGYHYILALDSDFDCNNNEDGYFRRHCVVSKILPHFDYVLFVDADIGVVNPQKRIEDYMDHSYDIIFYDRFYNWEVMAGSYLARNTKYAAQFLAGWADQEHKIPNRFHGTDNGAIHQYLVEILFPNHKRAIKTCLKVYEKSRNYEDLFTFEACIRSIFGSQRKFDRIAILEKGTGWARDTWLTNSMWSKEHDFMLHNWKEAEMYPKPRGLIECVIRL